MKTHRFVPHDPYTHKVAFVATMVRVTPGRIWARDPAGRLLAVDARYVSQDGSVNYRIQEPGGDQEGRFFCLAEERPGEREEIPHGRLLDSSSWWVPRGSSELLPLLVDLVDHVVGIRAERVGAGIENDLRELFLLLVAWVEEDDHSRRRAVRDTQRLLDYQIGVIPTSVLTGHLARWAMSVQQGADRPVHDPPDDHPGATKPRGLL